MTEFRLGRCVFRVEDDQGQTWGAGFLIGPDLAVTCAHVVQNAGGEPGEALWVRFHQDESQRQVQVLREPWAPAGKEDVAFLRIDSLPEGTQPAILGPADNSSGHKCQSLGYPADGEVEDRWPAGVIRGLVSVGGLNHRLLQIRSDEIGKGLSGAPVLDLDAGLVIGMLTSYEDLQRAAPSPSVRFAYAIQSETLRDIYPDLELVLLSEVHQDQTAHAIHSPQTNVEGNATGPVLSGVFHRGVQVSYSVQYVTKGVRSLPSDFAARIRNFLIEYLGTSDHPVPFGGREKDLTALDNWLADDAASRYLLLMAPAGRGKSALLVRWMERLGSPDSDLEMVFLPVSLRFNTVSPSELDRGQRPE